ncbi:MAG: ATP-binding protein [bacterium]
MTFIDREKELKFLVDKWSEPKAQLIVLWGKRRVGKTEIVKQFIKDKPAIYFLAENTSMGEQLRKFSLLVGKFFNESLLQTRGFTDWEQAFLYLKEKNKRFIFVIDEFPYLIQSNNAIPAIFQKGWDEYLSGGKNFLILVGSSISMMETEVLGYRSPLYGRRTGQWQINPMAFDQVSFFRKGKSFEDRLLHYSVAGGIPAYHLQFSVNEDFFENIRNKVLKKGQFLYDEVEFLLREELREPRYYFALLQAIALGKRKLSEIVNATGLSQPVANKYLTILADLHIVERELPVTEQKPLKSKRGLYKIADEYFNFWFRFVFPNRSALELDRIEEVIKIIKKEIPLYISYVYEKVAQQILLKHTDLFFPFSTIGKWWNKNEEIDIVGLNPEMNAILFGEVKWSNKPVGLDIYENLKKKAKNVIWGKKQRKEYYVLFSKSGFTDSMLSLARKEKVRLFVNDELKK